MRRLSQFWRRQGKLSKAVLAVGAVVFAGLLIIALSRGSDDDTTVTPETEITASAPMGCLDAAGLSDVEERDVDLWRGFHEVPPYAIIVHRLSTPARAPKVVAGTYAVTGSFKVSAKGARLTVSEGLWADALVQDVAACLGG